MKLDTQMQARRLHLCEKYEQQQQQQKEVISANRRHDERSPKGRMSSEIQKEVPTQWGSSSHGLVPNLSP